MPTLVKATNYITYIIKTIYKTSEENPPINLIEITIILVEY